MRSKKGQITWFIIIGIVILVGVGTFLYMRQTAQEGKAAEIPAGRETRYEGEQEIRSFVDSCIKPIVLQGLEIQRLQGGYIEIPSESEFLTIKDKEGNEQIKVVGTSKNVVIDANDQGNDAPFWVTKYGIAIPSKGFMESELADYVSKEVDKCVGDFKQFTDMGFKIEKEPITSNVSFAKSVWVNLKFPITVTKSELNYKIEDFNIEVPINMERIYNIASDLALYQDSYAYLESFTLDLVEKYSWRGGSKEQPHYLPPKRFTTAGFDCSQTTWTLDEVKNGLKNNYNQNLKYLKIANTKFEREVRSNPTEQAVLDGYIQHFFTEQYPATRVEYVYDRDWFFNLDILPKSGSTIRPDRTSSVGIPMIPKLCTFKYRFNYFYDFPVMLKITDDESAKIDVKSNTFEKGAGYEFHVPLWVFVCGNQERGCTGRAELFDVNSTLEETAFCEDSQKLSGDITIKALAGTAPMKDVDVYYHGASSMQNCFMGRTGDDGTVTSKFPFCKGCSVELYKQGYSAVKQKLDVLDYSSKVVEFNMAPFVELNANAKLIDIKIFIRSWHETDKFTNANKMIDVAREYGYTASLSPNLAQLKSNKALMALLKGEIDPDPAYQDKMIITATGLDTFYYIYPDPEDAKLKLGSGTYNINLVVMGKADIRNESGQSIIKGEYPLSRDVSYTWNSGDLTGKSSVTFYGPVEHTSAELNPGQLSTFTDSIFQNKTIKAELLYEAGTDSFGNCLDYSFSQISGRVKKDFSGGTCRQAFDIDIQENEYLPYIMPELD